jgi:sugar lactone lactonase YvrE
VFLADDFDHRIEKQDAAGNVLSRWSLLGFTPPVNPGPDGIAVDRDGNVYASDPSAGRVLKLSSSGKLLAQWGAGGSQPGRFWFPGNLALDGRGHLWVDDAVSERVQALGVQGRYLRQIRIPHMGAAMALDRQGNIYVGQLLSHVIYISKFSPAGKLLGRWGHFHLGQPPDGIAVAPNGEIDVLGMFFFPFTPGSPARDGTYILRLGPNGRQRGLIKIQRGQVGGGIAVDAYGNTYIAYGAYPRIAKRTPDGQVVASAGRFDFQQNAVPGPLSLTLDTAGNVYVAETGSSTIQKFSPRLALLATYGFPGSYPGQFHHPGGIAVDGRGDIYVADTDNHRIQRFVR